MPSSILIAKLRPFIIICQVYGLIPFSMEMDPDTGGFQKFTVSPKKIASWWYAFVFILQVTCYLISMILRAKNVTKAEDLGVSPVVLSLTATTPMMYMIQVFFSRIVVLKLKPLRRVITLIQEVEQHLWKIVQHSGDTLLPRSILGFFFATIMVCLNIDLFAIISF